MEIYFWFRKSTVSSDTGTISCVIKIDGVEATPFSTKIKTTKDSWNAKEQSFEGKDSATKELVKENIIIGIRIVYKRLLTKNIEHISPELVKQKYLESKQDNKKEKQKDEAKNISLIEVMEQFIKHQQKLADKNQLSKSTMDSYHSRRNIIEKYLLEIGKSKIPCRKFDISMIEEFEFWLLTTEHKRSYISTIFIFLKQIQKYALAKKIIKKIPLQYYKIELAKEQPPIVLEPEELKLIEEYNFSPRLQRLADAWLFCYETSLSFGDYKKLQNTMLKVDENGVHWIAKKRGKTEELQMIPLSEKALNILSKYSNSLEELPKFIPSTANINIKKIAKLLDINIEKITWHTSRKCFANKALNYKKMREITIASVMGWGSTRQLKNYARINKPAISEEFFV